MRIRSFYLPAFQALLLAFSFNFAHRVAAQPVIQLQEFASGFIRPVEMANCGDSRMFIVEKRGIIWILDSLGNRLPQPFIDLQNVVYDNGNEQGLLGLAFHPDYANNGYFFVNYIRSNGDTRIARYNRLPGEPDRADSLSERKLLDIDQPYSNHNGGSLKFGHDGLLYCGMGDGGSAGDPQGNGQKKDTHLGKILRIDVNNEASPYYLVPSDNPFVNDPAYLPEIWALGLRNPWRISFDRLTGDFWIADVGQNAREEINFEPADHPGGLNYGWRCYEGNSTYNTSGCQPQSNYTFPIFQYNNPGMGCSVTGGFVYRGALYPDLYGYYLNTDYCSGRWWATRQNDDGTFTTTQIANLTDYEYTSFGEDNKGELYVAGDGSGKIFKIRELCSGFQATAATTAASCPGPTDGSATLTVTGGALPVTIAWSNGASTLSVNNLAAGEYSVTLTDGATCRRELVVTIDAQFNPIPTISPSAATICNGQPITLTASAQPQPEMAFQWYFDGQVIEGAHLQQYEATMPGVYTVTYIDPAGGACVFEASTPAVIGQLPTPEITFQQGQPLLCPGQTAVLATVVPVGFQAQWTLDDAPISGANADTYTAADYGCYSVALTDLASGCVSPSAPPQCIDFEVVLPPAIGLANDTLVFSDGAIGWPEPYQWLLDGQPISGATQNYFVPTQTGLYSCVLTSANGCTYTPSYYVEFQATTLPESVLSWKISPNPTSGAILVDCRLKSAEATQWLLTDAQGRTVKNIDLDAQREWTQRFDLSDLPAGAYRLTMRLSGGAQVSATVIKR